MASVTLIMVVRHLPLPYEAVRIRYPLQSRKITQMVPSTPSQILITFTAYKAVKQEIANCFLTVTRLTLVARSVVIPIEIILAEATSLPA